MKAKILLPLLSLTLGALPLLAELKYFPKDKEQLISLIADENIKLDEIDTSKITDMSFLFCQTIRPDDENHIDKYKNPSNRENFSEITAWDMSNVENVEGMFSQARGFNQPLDS